MGRPRGLRAVLFCFWDRRPQTAQTSELDLSYPLGITVPASSKNKNQL